jgi:hypothetical protein
LISLANAQASFCIFDGSLQKIGDVLLLSPRFEVIKVKVPDHDFDDSDDIQPVLIRYFIAETILSQL